MNQEYQKWLAKLLGFDFDIEYKAGLENKATDALSRVDATATLLVLIMSHTLKLTAIEKAVEDNTDLGRVLKSLQNSQTHFPGYSLLRDNLMYKGRLVLPRDSSFVQIALQERHDSKGGEHGGFLKIY